MGLLYLMPVSENEVDRVEVKNKAIHLKSYGLPLVFWGYLLAILGVIFIMAIAIKDPVLSVLNGEDEINRLLGIGVTLVLAFIPFGLLCFFFYEKTLCKNDLQLLVIHKVFWIPVKKTVIHLKLKDSFTLEHYLDSPNMARLEGKLDMKGFENKGYFELFAISSEDKLIQIDRCSQRRELVKLKEILSKY
mgnify:FL=1|tara:strand:- start:15694 stop:16263 length:570 start_codon:yes stop_codon:yes gene_type:complete